MRTPACFASAGLAKHAQICTNKGRSVWWCQKVAPVAARPASRALVHRAVPTPHLHVSRMLNTAVALDRALSGPLLVVAPLLLLLWARSEARYHDTVGVRRSTTTYLVAIAGVVRLEHTRCATGRVVSTPHCGAGQMRCWTCRGGHDVAVACLTAHRCQLRCYGLLGGCMPVSLFRYFGG
jgi:hypothetical protein